MAMEINGSYNQHRTDYAGQLRTGEKTDEAEKLREEKRETGVMPVPQDVYISSEESGTKPSGLYRLGQDENGNPKVLYDDPKKPANAKRDSNPKKTEEHCTTNTDQVDREIEKLKEEIKQLEQQIKSTSGDEKKVRELEKKLAQTENELNQKDNDAYRRQRAGVTVL